MLFERTTISKKPGELIEKELRELRDENKVIPDLVLCFKCGKGGGVISFVQEIEKKSFPAAIRFLADKLGLEVAETED